MRAAVLDAPLPLSPGDFARIAAHAKAAFGLHLPQAKAELVRARLLRRLQALGCPDFAAYADLLDGPQGPGERGALATALTTNVSHFFREAHHFDLLARLCRDRLPGQRLRFWSAGCSAGQEAYSMAMTVLTSLPAPGDTRILATDIDAAVLARARAASYPADELAAIPAPQRGTVVGPGGTLAAAVRGLVRVAELNLMADWPIRGPFDAIFCRNVAIYFDKPTQARLWARFAALLRPGGLLCIGHSERLSGPAVPLFTPAGITAYRRIDPTERTRP